MLCVRRNQELTLETGILVVVIRMIHKFTAAQTQIDSLCSIPAHTTFQIKHGGEK